MALFDLSSFVDGFGTPLTINRANSNRVLNEKGKYSKPATSPIQILAKFQPLSKAAVELVPEGYELQDSEELHTSTQLLLTVRANGDETTPADTFTRNGKQYEIIGEYGAYADNGNFYKYITGTFVGYP